MKRVTFKANATAGLYRTELAGREYLVVPVVAIKDGVLNGERVLASEVGKHVGAWNGIPLTLGHPQAPNGEYISANAPEIVANAPGRFYHAQMQGDALHGEMWLDVALCQTLSGDAWQALTQLEAGIATELSTGYYCDLELVAGVFKGKRFNGVQRNHKPDHLAILLHEQGACSWNDGCGGPRVNKQCNCCHGGTVETNQEEEVTRANADQTGVMIALYPSEAMARELEATGFGEDGIPWEELHVTLAYYGEQDDLPPDAQGRLLQAIASLAGSVPVVYAAINGEARFFGEGQDAVVLLADSPLLRELREAVVDCVADWAWIYPLNRGRFTPHVTLGYVETGAETPYLSIPRRDVVLDAIGVAWGGQVTLFPLQGLVRANEATGDEGDQPGVKGEGGNDGVVARLLRTVVNLVRPTVNTTPDSGDEAKPGEHETMEDTMAGKDGEGVPTLNREELAAIVKEAVGAAVGDVGALVKNALDPFLPALEAVKAEAEQKRTDLVERLSANSAVPFDNEELSAMSGEQLAKIETLANATIPTANYNGRGGVRGNVGEGEEELGMPELFPQKKGA
jgi:2'-5' RNA ligase